MHNDLVLLRFILGFPDFFKKSSQELSQSFNVRRKTLFWIAPIYVQISYLLTSKPEKNNLSVT